MLKHTHARSHPIWRRSGRPSAGSSRTDADGTRLDDRVGYRFAALLQPDFAADLPADTLGRLADREVVVVAADAPEPQAWLQAADASAILVRPDRYVLGAAYSLQELNALVAAI
jgi:3-(3-hydroxy-phenyl)propionate hydroxylase